MYGIDGRRKLPEQILDHLAGYRNSRPVRVGNAAADQRQLDIFGEVLRAASLYYLQVGASDSKSVDTDRRVRPSAATWAMLRELVERAAHHWAEPGSGIREVRGGPQSFLYGRLMCWVALNSGLELAREHGLDAPMDRWHETG